MDTVGDSEVLFRMNNLHRVQIGFSNGGRRVRLVRPEFNWMAVKFLLRSAQQSSRSSNVLAAITNLFGCDSSGWCVLHLSLHAKSLTGRRKTVSHIAKCEG